MTESKKQSNARKILAAEMKKEIDQQNVRNVVDISSAVLELRKEKKLSATALCARTEGLNLKTLNAVERGRIKNPSIRTLQALAQGLGTTVSDLFKQAEMKLDRNLYLGNQKGAYQVDFHKLGIRIVSFTPVVKDFFCGKVILGSRKRLDHTLLQHASPIYMALLVGRVEVRIEGKVLSLREGDNLFFNGILSHTFYNPLEREAAFLMVTAPSFL